MTILYGIHNCDTVKKARKWLDANQINYQFHDFRKDGVDRQLIDSLLTALPLEQLINKRSTTYRQLDEQVKQSLSTTTAPELLIAQPTLIKRPVLVHQQQHITGFKDTQYQEFFGQ